MKNKHQLFNEFETQELAHAYLRASGFVQDPYVRSAWDNPKSGYDAHTCRLKPTDTWLVTYYPPLHERRGRARGDDYRPRIKSELRLVGEHYGE